MNITEKVAYIKGLLEGLNLDDSKPEVKVIKAMIDLLDDVTLEISDIEDGLDEFVEQLDEVDEDLGALEEDYYGFDDCDEDDLFYEVTCPTCGGTVCLSEDVLDDGEMECPNCGEKLEFDFDDLCDETECACGETCECKDE